MTIDFLIASAIIAATLFVAKYAIRFVVWKLDDQKIRRHKQRRRGYVEIPIFDDQWTPERRTR